MPYYEVDAFLWRPGWRLAPVDEYDAAHARLIAQDDWLLDGLGSRESIRARLDRATEIVLIDLPLWVHFWLAAERQIAYATGTVSNPPADALTMPPTEGLFRNIAMIDRDWMPDIRRLVAAEEARGKAVARIGSFAEIDEFA